jgi:nucleoside-diphosphate-sugar epimerase
MLVTGSNGFLGVATAERLLARGTKNVRFLVRAGSDRRRLDKVMAKYPNSDARIVTGGLGSPKEAGALLDGVGIVLHLAAALSGPSAEMFLGTVVTTKNLFEAAAQQSSPPKIVLISSFGVYGVADLPKGHVVTEETPTEPHPERRDHYSHSKLRQEEVAFEYHRKHRVPLTVLRPGVIYGPGGGAFSSRVGLALPGGFLFLGGNNLLPLSYVDNCAEAICVAAENAKFDGDIYNVHDDDLVTAKDYLSRYQKNVKRVPNVRVPFIATMALSHAVEWYHRHSKGQLPPIFTPYKTRAMWKGNGFSNAKLRSIGFRPIVSTDEGLARNFEYLKTK